MFRSETEFVNWLQGLWRGRTPGLTLGIGDDAALVRVGRGRELILTTDLSIEGVHFLHGLHPPRSVGHRALARALSDVAAMGGIPRFALLSIAISRRVSTRWVKDFYGGVKALASQTGVALIGGDTAMVSRQTFADVVVAGEIPPGRALLRSGARAGDHVFVSGRPGLSALGLETLKSARQPTGALAGAVRAHLYPRPRIELGRFLREERLASALMDLSDGLSTDLERLCAASGVGAVLWSSRIPAPVSRPAGSAAAARALDLALNGGEDYELLFTVRPRNAERIPRRFHGLPLHCIGEIRNSKGLSLILPGGKPRPIESGGYDHFRGP